MKINKKSPFVRGNPTLAYLPRFCNTGFMAYPIVVEYIKNTRKSGFSDIQIREELEKAGWPTVEIDSAFEELDKPVSPSRFVPRENIIEEALGKSSAISIVSNTALSPMPAVSASVPVVQQKKKSFAFIVGIAIFVLALGAGAGGFTYYRLKVAPKRAVASAIQKFKSMKTYRYEAELVLAEKNPSERLTKRAAPFLPPFANVLLYAYSSRDIEAPSSPTSPDAFKIRVKGAYDRREAKNFKHELTLTLGTRAIKWVGENIEMAIKLVDGSYYFQFTQLPPFDSAALIGYGLPRFTEQSLVGKWASFNPAVFGDYYNSYVARLADIDPSFAGMRANFKEPTDLITKNEQEQIQKLWEESSFFSWDEDIFSEDLRGVAAYRVKGKINRAELARFFESAASVTDSASTDAGAKELDEMLDSLGDVELNLWVSKNDERIIKTTAHATLADPEAATMGVTELLLAVDFSDADKDIAITAPDGARDLPGTLSAAFADSADDIATASLEARDARRIRDLALIQRHIKTYMERNGKYPGILEELVPEYIADMPRDPKNQKSYHYELKTRSRYVLSAELENRQHPVLLRDANPKNALYDVTQDDL